VVLIEKTRGGMHVFLIEIKPKFVSLIRTEAVFRFKRIATETLAKKEILLSYLV